MNKKIFFILSVATITFFSCNQRQERTEIELDSISITPNWRDNTTINLTLRKKNEVRTDGRSTSAGSRQTNIELRLTKNCDDTWRGRWRAARTPIPFLQMMNPIERRLTELIDGFTFYFTLDTDGAFIELDNWQELQSIGLQAIDVIIDEVAKSTDMDDLLTEQMRLTFGKMFATRENIETYFIQDIQLFFGLGGAELHRGDTIENVIPVAHPITGEWVWHNTQIVFQAAYSDSTCDIVIIGTIDGSELLGAVEDFLGSVLDDEKMDGFQDEMADVEFSAKVIANYTISLRTGLPEKVVERRYITVGDKQRITTTEITRRAARW